MTPSGGVNNMGTIFKINGDGSGYQALFSFTRSSGYFPLGSLCRAPNGKLFGFTTKGGTNDIGTLFSFNPVGNVYKNIVDYDFQNGFANNCTLTLARDGKLYGVTTFPLFKIVLIDPVTDTYSVLRTVDIDEGLKLRLGANFWGRLIQAKDNKLYGMTIQGGANDLGTLFSYDIAKNELTKIYDFAKASGSSALGYLCEASDGKLYGMTNDGGKDNLGVLFYLNPTTNTYTKFYEYGKASSGSAYAGNMVQVNDRLYGTVTGLGSGDRGHIFSYDLTTQAYKVEYQFTKEDGGQPSNGMLKAKDGLLYGMTASSKGNTGLVYRFNPTTSLFKIIFYFPEVSVPGSVLTE